MSEYNSLKRFREYSPDQKLQILRHEMLGHIATVRGYTHLLKQIDPEIMKVLPEDFTRWIDNLSNAGDDLYEILEALTGTGN